MIDAQQHAPGQSYSFALEQTFENYAVAFEKDAGDFFGGFGVELRRPYGRATAARR